MYYIVTHNIGLGSYNDVFNGLIMAITGKWHGCHFKKERKEKKGKKNGRLKERKKTKIKKERNTEIGKKLKNENSLFINNINFFSSTSSQCWQCTLCT